MQQLAFGKRSSHHFAVFVDPWPKLCSLAGQTSGARDNRPKLAGFITATLLWLARLLESSFMFLVNPRRACARVMVVVVSVRWPISLLRSWAVRP